MIDDEEIRLILDTQDSSTRVHQLATEVQALNAYMKDLAIRFNEGSVSQKDFDANFADASKDLRENSALLESVARNAGILGKSHGDLGQAVLQTSYAVQDFTSQLGTRGLAGGLAAVQNNIPGILAGLGVGGGLAGVISLVSVAVGAALPSIEKLFGAMDAEKVKAAAEELKHFADEAKAATTAPKTDVEKQVTAAFQGYAARGLDVVGLAAGAIESSPTAAIPTADQQAGVERYKALGGALGPGGAAAALGLALSPEGLREQLNAANVSRARQLVGRAQAPGDVGKKARNELRRLARDNPGAFPPDFGAFLKDVEETEGDRAIAEAAIEAADPDQQFADRNEGRLAAGKEYNDRRKLMEKNLDKATDEAIKGEESLERRAKEEARAAEQAARKAAHDADPSNRLAATAAAQQDAVTSEAMRQWQAGGRRESIPDLQRIISGAVHSLPDAGGDVALAVQMAAQQAYRKAQMDIARAMQRQRVWSEQRQ